MNRMKFLLGALVLAITTAVLSFWLSSQNSKPSKPNIRKDHTPDYYLENFSTLTMNLDGTPKNKLYAEFMVHYPDDDSSELTKPKLELFNIDKPPMVISSEKGWITANNEVILLSGAVQLQQLDDNNLLKLQVHTRDVVVKVKENYAETDEHATIIGRRTRMEGDGVRAYFDENRIELLNNVTGRINPKN